MNPQTVLIVDDEPAIAAVVALKLQGAGFATVMAHDGHEALRLAADRRFDLIIADVGMPGGQGLPQALAADERTGALPVLLLTGMGHMIDPALRGSPNVRGVLAKPFSPRELLARVRTMLGLDAPQKRAA
jgi:two-component system phosphate regulon response regulator PhoB